MVGHRSKITPAEFVGFMPTVEAQLRQELRIYAVEITRSLPTPCPTGWASTI